MQVILAVLYFVIYAVAARATIQAVAKIYAGDRELTAYAALESAANRIRPLLGAFFLCVLAVAVVLVPYAWLLSRIAR